MILLSVAYQCPEGTEKYIYDQSSLDLYKVNITRLDDSTDAALTLLSPSPSELSSDDTMMFMLQLTPSARKSNVFISVQAKNASYVSFETDNQAVEPVKVSFCHMPSCDVNLFCSLDSPKQHPLF